MSDRLTTRATRCDSELRSNQAHKQQEETGKRNRQCKTTNEERERTCDHRTVTQEREAVMLDGILGPMDSGKKCKFPLDQ